MDAAPSLSTRFGCPMTVSVNVSEGKDLVIGKLDDLNRPGTLRPSERTLDWVDQGSPKANWKKNSELLRKAMKEGEAHKGCEHCCCPWWPEKQYRFSWLRSASCWRGVVGTTVDQPKCGIHPSNTYLYWTRMPHRLELRFVDNALRAFEFLCEEFGFVADHQEVTLVVFSSEALLVRLYHGRRSFEIGFELSRKPVCNSTPPHFFNLHEILTALVGREYQLRYQSNFFANTPRKWSLHWTRLQKR